MICRKTGQRRFVFLAEAFFYLHIINQFEKDDCIFLDICAYRDPAMLDCMYVENLKVPTFVLHASIKIKTNEFQCMQRIPEYAKMFRGRPIRFVLPLLEADDPRWAGGEFKFENCKASARLDGDSVFVVPERLCNLGCETPRINYQYFFGKPYRFFYAISSDVDASNPGTVSCIRLYKVNRGRVA